MGSMEARLRMSEVNMQGSANTAWAFVTMLQLKAKLRMSELNEQDFANTAWTFVTTL